MINKNFYRKTNDKKILHKVGKQWKVVSVALLMAIGGGAAVATHANAQSTNAASNNNVKTEANVAHADFAHHLQGPVKVNTQSAAPKSANSAASASAVSYLPTSGGSAASYHAEGAKAANVAKSNANLVNSYVKSLNAKFPAVHSAATASYASANGAYRRDNAAAHRYSALANNKNAQSTVSELASKAGLTTSDFISTVKYTAPSYANDVKAASTGEYAVSLASSLVNMFNNTNWTEKSAEANASSKIDDAQSTAAKNANNGALAAYNNAINASTANDTNLTNAQVSSISASAATQVALGNSGADSSAVSSLASSGKYSNSSAVSSVVSSAASKYASDFASDFAGGSSDSVSMSVSGASSTLFSVDLGSVYTSLAGNQRDAFLNTKANSNSVAVYQAISDTAAMSLAASVNASANSTIASANAHKATYASDVANTKAVASSVATSVANLSSASDLASDTAEVVNAIYTGMGQNNASSAAFEYKLLHTLGTTGFTGTNGLAQTLGLSSTSSNSDLVSVASAFGIDVSAVSSNADAIDNDAKIVASGASSADSDATSGISVSPAKVNESAGSSALSSAMSSAAVSASSNYTSSVSASNSYAASTDEDVTLASYYASSYSVNASSDASLASSVASSANAFYAANADAKYAAASSAVALNAGIAKNNTARAHNIAMNIWLFNADKFITVTKDGLLHKSVDYGSANDKKLAKVTKGSQYKVNGIAIANNGAVRYNITMADGTTGYFTNAAGYVEPTYALALPGNHESAKALKTVRMYKDMARTQYAGQNFSKGDTLDDVTAVSVDGDFGGYTVFEDLKSGYFFTSNVKCVNATANKANKANKSANAATGHQVQTNPVQFWN